MRRLLLIALTLFVSLCAAQAQEPTEPGSQGTKPAATAPDTAARPPATAPDATVSTQGAVQTPATAPKTTATPAGTFWVPEPEERWFFPQGNWIYGFAEFDFAPPHNEPDPNFCAANAGNYGGVNSQCNLFARYLLGGQVEVRPFGKTALRRVKFFWNPTFVFGNNVPQYKYTWSWDGIGWERQWGAAVYLGRRFDLRVTQQFLFQRFSSRDLGPAYLGPNGPWGRFVTIGVRKYFGNPKVHDEGAQ